ncbi:MAG: transposase [Lepagella sp.]
MTQDSSLDFVPEQNKPEQNNPDTNSVSFVGRSVELENAIHAYGDLIGDDQKKSNLKNVEERIDFIDKSIDKIDTALGIYDEIDDPETRANYLGLIKKLLDQRKSLIELRHEIIEDNITFLKGKEEWNEEIQEQKEEIQELKEKIQELKEEKESLIKEARQKLGFLFARSFDRLDSSDRLPLDPTQIPPLDEEMSPLSPEERADLETDFRYQERVIAKAISPKKHPKSFRLDLTPFPVIERHLFPDSTTDENGDILSEYTEVGTEQCDLLELEDDKICLVRYISHRVAVANEAETASKILMAPLPVSPLGEGVIGASILADIIISLQIESTPGYQLINRYRDLGLRLSPAILTDWYERTVEMLREPYSRLCHQVLECNYIQTHHQLFSLIDNDKRKKAVGNLWCVRDIKSRALFFWFDRHVNESKIANELFASYCGTLQCYVDEPFEDILDMEGIRVVGSWEAIYHIFDMAALWEDKNIDKICEMVDQLFAIELKADDDNLSSSQRRKLRQKEAYPIIRESESLCEVLLNNDKTPAPILELLHFFFAQIEELSRYVNDGEIPIDIADLYEACDKLRDNYKLNLACENNAAAYRTAILLSLIATGQETSNLSPRQTIAQALRNAL